MKRWQLYCAAIIALLSSAACTSINPVSVQPAVVPKPAGYAAMEGTFILTAGSGIMVMAGEHTDEVRRNVAEYLAARLRAATGYAIPVTDSVESLQGGGIVLQLADTGAAPESYMITIEKNSITITAPIAAGLFRAVQTLRQLFGPDIESKTVIPDKTWSVNCAAITDSPAYPYRGLMIDVARHFFPTEVIMRQIDLAASYKINKLHLHLTDDQGWRIEIKSRPALTEIGSLGAVNGDPGGFYTQDDFSDIVQYAAARYIEVIPEIDMPGHVNAALVAIPELNRDGKAAQPRTDIEVGYSTFQCRSEITYQFCDDIIRELAAISPSPYFHVGGDEAYVTSQDDYHYFMGRVSEIAKKYGKTTIGWTPYERGDGVTSDAVVQNWDGFEGSCMFADSKGLPVILSPPGAYLDQKYNAGTRIGLQWRGHVNLERAYNWYPRQIGPESTLLGIESTLWTETIVSEAHIDYMLYPRLMANAEIGWTAESERDFDDFTRRLPEQLLRLDMLEVQYSKDYQ